ncbi:sigma-70 family RNA polymerase sigma factor [uncultured Paludibaculum sp.]|uniref:RNA polymerase sigma factor n=1 Tax=uncultured Paludibaculum sp. TaxID=1765020 RepID=UPI002AABAF5D|nr:sigma-70 family RNA polymerase sigma factor [uncultured Paludibaculum sp.]
MEVEQLACLTDDLLAEQFKTTGDGAFFAEIFRRYRAGIFRCCLAVVRDQEAAADLTQTTFLRGLEGIDRYTGGNLRGWLVTIARHQSINWLRAKNRGPQVLIDEEFPELRSYIEQDLVSSATIRELLTPLTEMQQRCLKLFWLNGLTYEETATLTGVEVGKVRSHIQNGMRRMRKAQVDSGKK